MVRVGHDSAVRPDDASQTLRGIDGTRASAVGGNWGRATADVPVYGGVVIDNRVVPGKQRRRHRDGVP